MGRAGEHSKFALMGVTLNVAPRRFQGRRHDGKRLGIAAFAATQQVDSRTIPSIGGEMKTANTFDRHDLARSQSLNDRRHGSITLFYITCGPRQGELWTTGGAGIWLCMEATIARVFILAQAMGAHREARHGGLGAIIGQCADQGKARAAVGAIDERIAITPIYR